jgi:putative restriction endonuclease
MDERSRDHQVRIRAFEFLSQQTGLLGDVLPWSVLSRGFDFDGQRVPLIGPQGIFKPAVLPEMPLSVATAPEVEGRKRPYNDGMEEGGILNYRYRGADPLHRDNVGLRLAMERGVPLVYLFGVVKGEYLPAWPVYVVGDDPSGLSFRIKVDERESLRGEAPSTPAAAEARRSYVTTVTLRRLHQETFRQRVLHAYQGRCAICRLKHVELLEAAHIVPDGDPLGEPIVPNGLALCAFHHTAFDRHIFGIRPDLVVEVREDILAETDGPMLRHGLQEISGLQIVPPRASAQRPRRDLLEIRYEIFRKAS